MQEWITYFFNLIHLIIAQPHSIYFTYVYLIKNPAESQLSITSIIIYPTTTDTADLFLGDVQCYTKLMMETLKEKQKYMIQISTIA